MRQKLLRHQDEPWRAEAALKAVLLDERLLNRVKRTSGRESFNRDHFCAIEERGQIQTARHGRPVHDHRAAPAQALPAALARAKQAELALKDFDHRLVDRHPGHHRPVIEHEANRPALFAFISRPPSAGLPPCESP